MKKSRKVATLLSTMSPLALVTLSSFAGMMPLGKQNQATPASRMSTAAIARATDRTRQREFTVFLKPEASSSAAAVVSYFKKLGFTAEYRSATNAVKLHGTYPQAEAAGHFSYIADEKLLIKPSAEPTFPPEISAAIAGTTFRRGPMLDALALPNPPYGTKSTMPCYGAAPTDCGFGPADYAALYDIPANLNGAGQIVDIAAFTTFCASDLTKFQSTFGLTPAPNITPIYLSGTPTGCGSGEPTLDLTRVYGTAPGATIRIWFAEAAFLSSLADIYEDIAADQAAHPATAVTTSYGLEENYLGLNYASTIATLMSNVDKGLSAITGGSAEKVALFAASGDRGAYCAICGTFSSGLEADGWLTVLFPASDHWVLAAGGTTLYPKKGASPGHVDREKEACWSGSGRENFGGSGGGVSSVFKIPTWQLHVKGTASQTHKNVPDLSTVADPNTPPLFVFDGALTPTGGTSASSPTWAGIAALINENRAKHGKGRLTEWPKRLYEVAHREHGEEALVPIKEGFNGFYGGSPERYNNCAGLGTPNVKHLAKELE
jgi:subtilase family serine protease